MPPLTTAPAHVQDHRFGPCEQFECTLPDEQDHIRRITRSTDIPIMVDAEDGRYA